MNSTLPAWPPETSLPGGVDVAALALGSQRPFGLRLCPHTTAPGPPLTMTETWTALRGWNGGEGVRPRRSPTDRLLRSPGRSRERPGAGRDPINPYPGHTCQEGGTRPRPGLRGPASQPCTGSTLPAERGGARGAHWWVQKFKPNSTEPARRARKGGGIQGPKNGPVG